MKKPKFTKVLFRTFSSLLAMTCLCLFATSLTAQNCTMTCNDQVNVVLDNDGVSEVRYDMVLEDANNPLTCSPNGPQAFVVSVKDVWGAEISTSPNVTCANIGQILTYEVKHWATGNKCTGEIAVMDMLMPFMTCQDAYIPCSANPDAVPGPVITDNCDNNVEKNSYDVYTATGCEYDYSGYITRTWTACDDYGNCNQCVQTIYFERFEDGDLTLPPDVDLECGSSCEPSNTGMPRLGGFPIDNQNLCGWAVDYEDQVIPICGGAKKIIRHWTILNWCSNAGPVYHDQVIKKLDTMTDIDVDDFTVGTDPYTCGANVSLPAGNVTEECSGYSVITFYEGGFINGNGGNVYLDKGYHEITYVVTDDCGNTDEETITVHVIDDDGPIMACTETTQVTLLSNGETWINATTFDQGSYDNCLINGFDVRRMDNPDCPGNDATPFGPTVSFSCCDVGSTVMVELRATDYFGNTSSCMVEVLVDDKLTAIECPPDVTLDCGTGYTDPDFTGYANADGDACSAEVTYTDSGNLTCGVGTINRTWRAEDASGNVLTCVQKLVFIDDTPVTATFPADKTLTSCPDPGDTGIFGVATTNADCESIAIDYEDQLLTIVDDACYKIERTWTVLNWCNYDPNDPNNTDLGIPAGNRKWRDDGDGYWKYVQTIKIIDSVVPFFISSCDDREICTYEEDCEPVDPMLSVEVGDDCTPTDLLTVTYQIDANNNGSFDVNGSGTSVTQDLPYGTHRIVWTVYDGCDNYATCDYVFDLIDCKPPSPICYNGLALETMPNNGMIELWASSLNSDSYDNCDDDLILRLRKFNGPPAPNNPALLPQVLTYDCDEIGTQFVELWVGDSYGNWDYCETYVIIQDNNGVCGGGTGGPLPSIAGRIASETDENVSEVQVSLDGGMGADVMTGDDGYYMFPALPVNNNYDVTPEKDINLLNGVSTFDIVLISRHILGIQALDTPYKLIAADANKSNNVSTLDVVALRRVILNLDSEFPNGNASWRFIESDFVFTDLTNPFATSFPELTSFNSLTADAMGTDFIAVKVGDVDNSAIPNNLLGSAETRNANTMVLAIDDASFTANETVTIDVKANNFVNMLGYQFTMNFDATALEFVNVTAGAINVTDVNFGLNALANGIITTSWNDAAAITVKENDVLFTMTFTATAAGQLSDLLSVSSEVTRAEAYDNTQVMDVAIAFNGNVATTSTSFELYQNQPNPFTDATVISFNLPEAGQATLTVMDVTGKTLKMVKGDFAQGFNQVSLKQNEIAATGVLYYQIETATETATKKMLLIK